MWDRTQLPQSWHTWSDQPSVPAISTFLFWHGTWLTQEPPPRFWLSCTFAAICVFISTCFCPTFSFFGSFRIVWHLFSEMTRASFRWDLFQQGFGHVLDFRYSSKVFRCEPQDGPFMIKEWSGFAFKGFRSFWITEMIQSFSSVCVWNVWIDDKLQKLPNAGGQCTTDRHCPTKTLSVYGDMEPDQLHVLAIIFICCCGTWQTREPFCRAFYLLISIICRFPLFGLFPVRFSQSEIFVVYFLHYLDLRVRTSVQHSVTRAWTIVGNFQ